MFKLYIKHSKGYRAQALLTPFFVAIEALIEAILPLFMADVIDRAGGDEASSIVSSVMNKIVTYFEGVFPNVHNVYVYVYGVIMLLLAIISLFSGVISGILATNASSGFAKNVRKDLYYHIQEYSFENIDKYSTSSLITRLTTDITNCQQSFQMTTRISFRAPLIFIFSLVMAFLANSELAWIFVVASPILVILLAIIITRANPYFKKMFKKYDALNLVVQENITGIRTVKAYTTEPKEDKKFAKASDEVAMNSKAAEKIIALNSPVIQFIIYACVMVVSYLGTMMIVRDHYGEGSTLYLFITYAIQILSALMMVSMVFMMLVMAKASTDRIVEALNEVPTIQNPANPIYEVKDGSVEFRNVDFSYVNDDEKLALKNISFKIESGMTVGVFGGTGSGKSTVMSLIPRLYDPTRGEVLVGGINVKEYDLKTLRDQVSMVLQKNVLFTGSIKDNLRWGNKDATDEELIRVCKLAQADEFVSKFPEAYDTHIEQGGNNVSGGQKQRLCIARALLKKPKILILDDSTSAVDTKTDALIRKAFREEIPETTKFIISQRITSIEDSDIIIFMNNGDIENIGTHQQLLKENEIYNKIYQAQTKGGR